MTGVNTCMSSDVGNNEHGDWKRIDQCKPEEYDNNNS